MVVAPEFAFFFAHRGASGIHPNIPFSSTPKQREESLGSPKEGALTPESNLLTCGQGNVKQHTFFVVEGDEAPATEEPENMEIPEVETDNALKFVIFSQ
jgi:hypothetical protein